MPLPVIERLLDGLDGLPPQRHTFCLHGGEPLLVGKTWFSKFVDLVAEHNGRRSSDSAVGIALQTNGLLIDLEWVRLFQVEGAGVSVSLDGPPPVHDAARRGRNRGTHASVVRAIDLMAARDVAVGALAVLTRKSVALGAEQFYEYFRSVPLRNGLDVTPYIETGDTARESAAREEYEAPGADLSPFLKSLFDIWLSDTPGNGGVDIRMFDQLIGSALGFFPTVCNLTHGASCGRTPSVLPNGDIYACDLDVSQVNFRMGSVYESVGEACGDSRLRQVHAKVLRALKSRGCERCELLPFCGLTCPRHTFSSRDHSQYCQLMLDLVVHTRVALNGVARRTFGEEIDFAAGVHALLLEESQYARIQDAD